MAERSIVVRLKAEVSDFKRQIATASQSAQDAGKKIGDSITKNEQHINTLSNTAGLLGVAMVGAAAFAVKSFADFDQAMSSVQASTMESAENMELLRSAALDAGKRTVYSATEAAAAIEELAKAGVSTTDILGGGLDGALDLAAAGGIAVADAAETAASAMTQFGLEGSDVTHIADLLAAGAGKAQGGVADLGAALNQSGLVASQMGLSIEETVGSLTAFASAGLTGSDAGTSFRAMLLRLANPTGESAELMAELGINAYDAGGNFIGMAGLAGELQDSLSGLTQEQRNAALAQIFGQDAIRTSAILYEQGAEGIREWTGAVDEQGYAAEVAATRLDNLKGDLEELSGSFETALIGLGESGDGPLRALVQQATDVVNAFAELPDAAQGALLGIVGGGGLVLLGLAGLGKLVVGINEARNALKLMGVTAKIAATSVGLVGAALGIATVGLMAWADEAARARAMTEAFADTLDETANVTGETEEAIRNMLAEGRNISALKFDSAYTEAEKMGISFETLTEYVLGNADAIDTVNEKGDEFIAGSSAWEHVIQSREGAVQNLRYTLDTMAESLTEAERTELQKLEADRAAGDQQEILQAQYDATKEAVEQQENAIRDLIDAQAEAAGIVSSVMEAQSGFEAAIDGVTESIQQQIDELARQYEAQGIGTEEAYARAEAEVNAASKLDLSTEAGRRNQTALLDIKDAGYELLKSMEANGAEQGELTSAMQRTRDEFVKAAEQMGMTSDEANALADELGLIPENVTVTANLKDNITGAIEGVMYSLSRLPDSRTVTLNKVTNEITVSSGAGNMVARAEGGIVYGPGTSTSDSIPARLSNGEYVIKADSVQRYGKSFFDSLNAQRFATGGYVGAAPAVASGPGMGDLAGALDGMSFTLITEAGPIRAIARAEATGVLKNARGKAR